jgi:CspA family cold shock protein
LVAGLVKGRFVAILSPWRAALEALQAPEGLRGAKSSPALPDELDAWLHFSVIEGNGFRALEAGDSVEFEYEAATQNSFRFRATRVRML